MSAALSPETEALASVEVQAARTQRRRERVRHLRWMWASCAIDGGVLALYCATGAEPWRLLAVYGAMCTALITLSWVLLRSGFTERFRDPYISAYQMLSASAGMLAIAALAPNAAFHFYNVLLVTFTFGVLRMSLKQTLLAGGAAAFAVGGVMAWHGTVPAAAASSAGPLVAWTSYLTVLVRCVLVGLYGSSLRHRLRKRNEQLAESTARIEQLATHDELTGVLNRRAVWALLESHAAPPQSGESRLCIALLDLDHFKQVNDRHGHPVGDAVLQRFCQVVRGMLREGDRLGRYGGEEFLVLLPQMEPAAALRVVERLRHGVEAAAWSDIAPGLQVTVSVGVAAWRPGCTVAQLVAEADQALYRAKAQGRNRVCAAA